LGDNDLQELKSSIEMGFFIYDTMNAISITVTHDPFKPVQMFRENGVKIFVTDEPGFIEVLKSLKISGSQRSVKSQLKRENGRK